MKRGSASSQKPRRFFPPAVGLGRGPKGPPACTRSHHSLTKAPGARSEQRRRRSAFHTRLLGQLVIAFVVFVGSVVLCAIGGGLLGWAIAALFPRYYPSVFPAAATRPGFDAVQVGVAIGVGQGAAVGVFVGAVVVLALAIANRRWSRPQE